MATYDAPSAISAPPADRRRAWVVFAAVYFAAVVAPFNQYKVPPLIPVLVEQFRLSLVEAGLLMSLFSIAGLVMSLPAGFLFLRLGPRRAGIFSIGCTAVGCLLGFAATNGQVLLASRLLEGVGMGMTAVLALVTIAAWFPPAERGIPIGIFTTWIPVGNGGMLIVAPLIYEAFGWRAVWLLGGAAALVSLVFFALLVSLPETDMHRHPEQREAPAGAWYRGLLNPNAWLLSLTLGSFMGARVGFVTWAPSYLTAEGGFGLAAASMLVSLSLLITIPMALIGGWILDTIGSRRKTYSLGILLLIPAWAVILKVDPAWIIVPLLVTGVLSGLIPTSINAAAPDTASRSRDVGPAVGIVSIGRNGGPIVGPALLAFVLQAGGGWDGVTIALVAMTFIGLIAGWLAKVN